MLRGSFWAGPRWRTPRALSPAGKPNQKNSVIELKTRETPAERAKLRSLEAPSRSAHEYGQN